MRKLRGGSQECRFQTGVAEALLGLRGIIVELYIFKIECSGHGVLAFQIEFETASLVWASSRAEVQGLRCREQLAAVAATMTAFRIGHAIEFLGRDVGGESCRSGSETGLSLA